MQDFMIDISHVSFNRKTRLVFNDLTIQVRRGSVTAIMGPSGSGKTTLLQLIGAQLSPQSGRVSVDGCDIHALSKSRLLAMRKRMGLLFQSGALFTDLSVFDNVAFPLREHTDLNECMIRDVVLMKLEAVGLRGTLHLMPSDLSGGMSRRVALARALALDPALMMYDEPFTGQDPISLGVLARLIKQLNQLLKITTIIVSHDVKETCAIADYVYLIADNQLIGQGEPELLMQSDDPKIRQFMHGEADGAVPFHYPAKPYAEELMDA